MTFAPGDVVAERFRIERYIAHGGMGEVYEAEDITVGGRVALKTVLPEVAANPKTVERFKREIYLARKITHANVSRIYDLGTHRVQPPEGSQAPAEDIHFLTMELLIGPTLSERLREGGPMDTFEALPIIEQMAHGLDAAHQLGIIHRDFKSSNVVLAEMEAREGIRVIVTDFGLARGYASDASLQTLSAEGEILGTPAYMAPEQVEGLELTPAADIYALGIVMYEMVTGVRPFDDPSASPITVAAKRLSQSPPSPREQKPELTPAWEAVILRALARQPEERFDSVLDIPHLLRSGRADLSGPTAYLPAALQPGLKKLAIGGRRSLAFAATLALVALATVLFLQRPREVFDTQRPSDRAPSLETEPLAVLPQTKVRPSLAVLELSNETGSPDEDWLGLALADTITASVADPVGLREISSREILEISRILGLDSYGTDASRRLDRIRAGFDLTYVVTGSYDLLPTGSTSVLRVDLSLLDAASGKVVETSRATGATEQLADLVSRATAGFRSALALPGLTSPQALDIRKVLPASLDVARPYFQATLSLRRGDDEAAERQLAEAIGAQPDEPLPQLLLAQLQFDQGFRSKAEVAAAKALEASPRLRLKDRREAQALFDRSSGALDKALRSHQTIFDANPDSVSAGVALARVQIDSDRPNEALSLLETLRSLPAPSGTDPRIDIAQAEALWGLNRFEELRRYASEALDRASELGSDLVAAKARSLLGVSAREQGDIDGALEQLGAARDLYAKMGQPRGVASAVSNMAIAVHLRGDLDGARRLHERAQEKYVELEDELRVAMTQREISLLLWEQGRFDESDELLDRALASFKARGAKIETANALMQQGTSLHQRGFLEAAQVKYRDALSILSGTSDHAGVAIALSNLAEVLFLRGQLKEARELHEEALALDREIGDQWAAAYDQFRLGKVFVAQGDFAVARKRYEQALAAQEKLDDVLAVAETRLALAELDLRAGDFASAAAAAAEAEQFFRSEEVQDLQALALLVHSESLLRQGKDRAAHRIAEEAAKIAVHSDDRRVVYGERLLAARIRARTASSSERHATWVVFEALAKEARATGYLVYALEAELALGELQLSQDPIAGRAQLLATARAANELGLGLIAERASDLLLEADPTR